MPNDMKLFRLRVLTEYNSEYKYFVAHCLETGNVVTADDQEGVINLMLEILKDEVVYALEHEDFSNLLSNPAPAHVWFKWKEAAKLTTPQQYPLDIPIQKELPVNEQEVADVVFSKAA